MLALFTEPCFKVQRKKGKKGKKKGGKEKRKVKGKNDGDMMKITKYSIIQINSIF